MIFIANAISSKAPFISTKICSLVSRFSQRRKPIRHYHSLTPAHSYYKCSIDAEPLHRYQPGGYHPLALGDTLGDGRYKVLHKLGWGGYSTTWAAKDQRNGRYVAVKITVSEIKGSNELKILQALSALPTHHPGSSYVNRLLDHFTLAGPNGCHSCLVLEIVGPNLADAVDFYCKDNHLPSKLAKAFAKQTLQGLDFLADHDIVHGDLHTRNLALVIPDLDSLDEESFLARLGNPRTGAVTSSDNTPLPLSIPTQIVQPAQFRRCDILQASSSIKIIDFGEAFFSNHPPSTLHTPLVVRAPEVIFGDTLTRRVDQWSAGCLIFELVTGQPPFDAIMTDPLSLVAQMMDISSDEPPLRWQEKWHAMQQDAPQQDQAEHFTLQQTLEETYFFNDRQAEFTREDLEMIADVIARLLMFTPAHRATASKILAHDWFR